MPSERFENSAAKLINGYMSLAAASDLCRAAYLPIIGFKDKVYGRRVIQTSFCVQRLE